LENEYQNKDIFVHHSALSCSNEKYQEQFKYLVQGEYIEFEVKKDENNKKHPLSAQEVTGVKNGKLMYEHQQQQRHSQRHFKHQFPI
jgi:cold shock CspA family protein